MQPPRAASFVALALSFACASPPPEASPQLDAFRRKAQLRLARAALAAHDIDTAQTRLESALELARNAADSAELAGVFEGLGDVSFRRDQLGRAESSYGRALGLLKGEPRRQVLDKLGRVAVRRARYVEAAERYREALALGPSDAGLSLRLGEALLRAGQPDAARVAFQDAVESLDADSLDRANLHESIARRFLWLTEDRAAAAGHADKALAIRKAHAADAPEQLARALRSKAARTQDTDQAETYLQLLSAAEARRIRSRRLAAKGELEQAIDQQRRVLQQLEAADIRGLELAAALEAFAALEERSLQHDSAVAHRDQALDLRRELKLTDLPSSLDSLDKLASNLGVRPSISPPIAACF